MKRVISVSLVISAAALTFLGSTQGALGVETALTDYSRAVMLENPVYYWNFNEAGATDVAQDVMRYETETQMLPVANVTRTASYSTALGNAASFTFNSAFGSNMINRGKSTGAYAFEFWIKADADTTKGYIADFLAGGGDEPGIIHDYTDRYLELWFGGARTGETAELELSDTDWHHMVLAVNSDATTGTLDQIDVAIDGVVTTNVASVDAKQLNIAGNLVLGAWATYNDADEYTIGAGATKAASSFQGQIDEFAIYELGGMDPTQVADKPDMFVWYNDGDVSNDSYSNLRWSHSPQFQPRKQGSPGSIRVPRKRKMKAELADSRGVTWIAEHYVQNKKRHVAIYRHWNEAPCNVYEFTQDGGRIESGALVFEEPISPTALCKKVLEAWLS